MTRLWNSDEEAFLVDTHSSLTAGEQAEKLGRRYDLVIWQRMKLYRQGRISLSDQAYLPPWSREDDEFLEEHYSTMTMRTLSARLRRSETAIVMRKRRLGLHRTDGFYTANTLAEVFGIDPKGVAWFADQGWLKGKRTPYKQGINRPRYFSEVNVRRFIRRHPWLLRPEKMGEQHYFRSILRDEWRRDRWYSVQEAAKLLGCAEDTVLRHLQSGLIQGFKRQQDRKWGRWWVRRSTLQDFWDKVKTAKREHTREARHNYYLGRGLPIKVYTVWELHCPDCGEVYHIEAPPKAYSPEVLTLAADQHRCKASV